MVHVRGECNFSTRVDQPLTFSSSTVRGSVSGSRPSTTQTAIADPTDPRDIPRRTSRDLSDDFPAAEFHRTSMSFPPHSVAQDWTSVPPRPIIGLRRKSSTIEGPRPKIRNADSTLRPSTSSTDSRRGSENSQYSDGYSWHRASPVEEAIDLDARLDNLGSTISLESHVEQRRRG